MATAASLPSDVTITQSFQIFQQLEDMQKYLISHNSAVEAQNVASTNHRKELQSQIHRFMNDTRDQVLEQQRDIYQLRSEIDKNAFKRSFVKQQQDSDRSRTDDMRQSLITMADTMATIHELLKQFQKGTSDLQSTQASEADARTRAVQTKIKDLVDSQQAMTKAIEETLPEQLNLQLNAMFKQLIQTFASKSTITAATSQTGATSQTTVIPVVDASSSASPASPPIATTTAGSSSTNQSTTSPSTTTSISASSPSMLSVSSALPSTSLQAPTSDAVAVSSASSSSDIVSNTSTLSTNVTTQNLSTGIM